MFFPFNVYPFQCCPLSISQFLSLSMSTPLSVLPSQCPSLSISSLLKPQYSPSQYNLLLMSFFLMSPLLNLLIFSSLNVFPFQFFPFQTSTSLPLNIFLSKCLFLSMSFPFIVFPSQCLFLSIFSLSMFSPLNIFSFKPQFPKYLSLSILFSQYSPFSILSPLDVLPSQCSPFLMSSPLNVFFSKYFFRLL